MKKQRIPIGLIVIALAGADCTILATAPDKESAREYQAHENRRTIILRWTGRAWSGI